MTQWRTVTYTAAETRALGAALAAAVAGDRAAGLLILLQGPLGAGKTTFVQGLARGLGVDEPIVSPSFTLVHEHALPAEKRRLVHMDCYRLADPAEALDLGLADYLGSEDLILIEWPERAGAILEREALAVELDYRDGEDGRTITFRARGARAEQALAVLAAGAVPLGGAA
jgi:tRNA threonylcarbamoyladenosine biosynthesis protein TsaE